MTGDPVASTGQLFIAANLPGSSAEIYRDGANILFVFSEKYGHQLDRLNAMRIFVTVVESGSFSRAAKKLALGNPTVSESIKNLEEALGVRLLDRTTRRMNTTGEGALYYERCRAVLADIDEVELTLSETRAKPRGRLRVAVPAALGHAYIVPALAEFAACYPDLRTTVLLDPGPTGPVESGVDVAIQLGKLKDSRLVARKIYQTKHVACAAPALLARHGDPRHPKDLLAMNCLGFYAPNTGRLLEWQFRKGSETWNHIPAGSLLFNSSEALIDLAVRGTGVIYMLDVLIRPAVSAGTLKPILSDWTTLARPLYLVHSHKQHVPAKVRVFSDFIERLFGRLA